MITAPSQAHVRSCVEHVVEVGCWRPGSGLLGNLTLTTTAGRTMSEINAHLQSLVTAEAGTMRVEAGTVAAEAGIYCGSSVGCRAARAIVMQQGGPEHNSTNIFLPLLLRAVVADQ